MPEKNNEFYIGIDNPLTIAAENIYFLTERAATTTSQLSTTYSLDKRAYLLFNLPVRFTLKAFQRYLLRSIKLNSE